MFNHFKQELRDARKADPRVEEQLRARNVILVCAAAIAPLTALMWIAILLLWDNVGDPPSMMTDAGLLYPVLSLAGATLAMPLHKRRHYFGASLIAALPLLAVVAFLVSAVRWAL
ncbi:hypothetical protein KAJ83_08480 [Marivibrio halodurans]|uniref:Uncharacterized protein n=1 Tax=Marivibrio halodurans TaxID=2039722 RepID=A0A8J7RYG0_9PROT|nr:hypothetical protein [Marivibrio halodurans]MBP5857042.1 hypothetical protein [Marivibrio halodurans]